jgi:TRAP-type C4-dicarboxylate transport system substrate-binding protein
MFRVIADDILYDGHPVGRLSPSIWPTLRDEVEDALHEDRDAIREAHEKEIEVLTDSHGAALEEKDERVEELERALEDFRAIMDKINEGQSLLAQLEECRAEAARWRKAAEKTKPRPGARQRSERNA